MISDAEFDARHLWHPFTSLLPDTSPLLIESAAGVYLQTSDGRQIIDAISSWWVNIHGHSNPVIAAAIYKQALTLEHVIFAGFTHQPAIQLGKQLMALLPNNPTRIFYSDNGSTAVEVAIKMAMQFWYHQNIKKPGIIALQGAYHGDTFGSMSVGERGGFNLPFENYLFDVHFLSFPDEENEASCLQELEALAASGEAGIFIYEPLVQGAAGMRMYDASLLQKMLTIAKHYNLVTIADEVFTGFGRTGKWFASEYAELKPDIITVSKGITGGAMPLGVTACNSKIESAFLDSDVSKTFYHGHSYTANPLACAAALASMELLLAPDCLRQINLINTKHLAFSRSIATHNLIKQVRVCGTILAIELADASGTSYFNPIRKKIYAYFLERNILLRPLGNVIYILPPYIITAEELDKIYTAIQEFMESLT